MWKRSSTVAPAIAMLVALVCASLAACSQKPPFAFRSQQGAATEPLQRVRVYAPLVTGEAANPVNKAMYDAFQASLVLRLGFCRVAAEVSPAALPAATSPEGARPSAGHTLTIRIADSQVVQTRLLNQFHQQYGTVYSGILYFGLELADARSHASVWSARSSFKFYSAQQDDEIAGIGFARGVVEQLHRDGLLARCIEEPYLGCVADRREARQRAERIRDDRERFIAMKDLPECK